MRELTTEQSNLLSERSTTPIYLVDLGAESFSTNGAREAMGRVFVEGDAKVAGVSNWAAARIQFRPSVARVAQVVSNAWRSAACKIWLLPAVTYRQTIDPGYYVEDCITDGFTAADPILLLDGIVVGAQADQAVTFEAVHRSAVARWIPPIRITAPLANHLPKPGTVLSWQGDNYTLEAR